MVDLDQEPNRGRKLPKLAHGGPVELKAAQKDGQGKPHENKHLVVIRKSATIDLNMIHAFLDGKCQFDNSVIAAISK